MDVSEYRVSLVNYRTVSVETFEDEEATMYNRCLRVYADAEKKDYSECPRHQKNSV